MLNARQRKALNKLLDAGPDGFESGMTTRKYGSINSVSRVTAYRELAIWWRRAASFRWPQRGGVPATQFPGNTSHRRLFDPSMYAGV
ncbi:MAG: hypothetical protein ACREV4_08660 [Gammaproteobacteria bacterium]